MSDENRPMSLDEAQDFLDTVADELPPAFFNGLNGGGVLVPDVVPSPHGPGLYTLGTYHNEPYGLGRYIRLNYGSFARVHGHRPLARQQDALRTLLRHELTHHIESLAGVRDLEVKDEQFLEEYARPGAQKKPKPKAQKDE